MSRVLEPGMIKKLFLKWLEEWRAMSAKLQQKTQYTYKKGLAELETYIEPLYSGHDAGKVKYLGPATAKKLQRELEKYCKEFDVELPTAPKPPTPEQPAKKTKPKRATKAYIPVQKSGGWAIMLTLYQQSLTESYRGYMTKVEITTMGQKYSDTHFTLPSPNSHYTAWSSMATLLAKDIVSKSGNPAKFELTWEGEELAKKLHEDYLTQDNASISVEPSSSTSSTTTTTTTSQSRNHGKRSASSSSKASSSSSSSASSSMVRSSKRPAYNHTAPTTPMSAPTMSSSADCSIFSPVSDLSDLKASDFDTSMDMGKKRGLSPCSSPALAKRKKMPRQMSSRSLRKPTSSNAPSFVLEPGTFEIILVIDVREHTAGHSKGEIQRQLGPTGVKTDIRALNLGDFVWIAQEREGLDIPGQLVKLKREVVLDYVVERKRMDDLASSIVDGRFMEQKYRFEAAQVKHPIYLIENFGRIENQRLEADRLWQAMATTQVVNGFFLKNTNDMKATVAYLTLMTRKIAQMYKDTAIVSRGIGEEKFISEFPDCNLHSTFADFEAQTMKTQTLSIREMFAKQLMQMAAVTANKAASIVEHYPTPQSLLAAYDAVDGQKEKEKLLKNVSIDHGTNLNVKTLGPAISINIAQLFTLDTLT